MGKEKQSPPNLLREGAKTFEERNLMYGDTWKTAGAIGAAVFPDGVKIKDAEEWSRFALIMHIINKLARIGATFSDGGHIDSSHDIMVYGSMLEALERERKGK